MTEKDLISLDSLMKHPDVVKVTAKENQQLIDRRESIPPSCEVFENSCIALEDRGQYEFEIDPEAARKLPDIIHNKVQAVVGVECPSEEEAAEHGKARAIGVVFSGGPAPGGHNVIAGIYDAAVKANPDTKVLGFLMGPDGVIENEYTVLTKEIVDNYRNLGGFGMIKTGRTKIDSVKKVSSARQTCKDLGLDALVIIGGDDSNTNAAFLAQELKDDGVQVIGVPKTIDGDIQVRDKSGNVLCAMSFGFHTAARAFATEISNLCTDASSDVKYWHICKVMGRVASHLALEVALQTHANLTLIGEELSEYVDYERIQKAEATGQTDYTAYGMTLRHLSRVICNGIVRRAAVGKNYGVMVIPEGVLEFINEIQTFIIKLNTIIADFNEMHDRPFHLEFQRLEEKLEYLRRLARRSREDDSFTLWNTRDDDLFSDLPIFFQEGLLMERDSHGNFPFSQVETDKVIMGLVQDYLAWLRDQGKYKVGLTRDYYEKTMKKGGADPQLYGPVLFRNYQDGEFLLMKEEIMSLKTLTQEMIRCNALKEGESIPSAVQAIYKKSIPSFKTQVHFYGYDGRGSDPTWFDCTYTYNLGLTVFSLIAAGATGQMAAIRNLERDFETWEPIGIPIGPLMHLEERKGKLTLVIEKSTVQLNSASFQVVKNLREKWLAAHPGPDEFRRPGPISMGDPRSEDRPITLALNALGSTPPEE
ncbi:phosphofructokinase [Desulfatibacillum aliphaticivorans]|uniref:Phosphofructokinase n=1 Tax=Desulfatibacillum aliphaticivorans TaxID=218208 RepID=B8FEA0_DESAL|nr:6-phosphofructokinase [Desulfatibacillum aliphaticivorans]ACL06881.1 phosphofructokinase [Desulfatibacillum aliphaticivorans]